MKRLPRARPAFLAGLTPAALRQLADAKVFARGEEYFADGRVRALSEQSGTAVAKVRGTETYQVELWQEGEELAYECSCPQGEYGHFCKHCVAVGLALLAVQAQSRGRPRRRSARSLEAVRRHLERETKAALVGLLLERAAGDASLFELLRLRVTKQPRPGNGARRTAKVMLDPSAR